MLRIPLEIEGELINPQTISLIEIISEVRNYRKTEIMWLRPLKEVGL